MLDCGKGRKLLYCKRFNSIAGYLIWNERQRWLKCSRGVFNLPTIYIGPKERIGFIQMRTFREHWGKNICLLWERSYQRCQPANVHVWIHFYSSYFYRNLSVMFQHDCYMSTLFFLVMGNNPLPLPVFKSTFCLSIILYSNSLLLIVHSDPFTCYI